MSNPLDSIVDAVKRNAGREFLVHPGGTLTFGEFHSRACGLARHLSDLGVGRGDRVAAVLANSPEYALLYFACLYLGAAVVPVNPSLHARDVRFIKENAGAKLILDSLPPLGDSLYGLPLTPFQGVSPEDLLAIVFTSGTTAFPKGVAHRIGGLVGNAQAFNEAMENGPGDRFLHLFPMSYSGGFFNLLIAPFLAGSSVVLAPGFGPRTVLDFWRRPRAQRVNALWLTPTIAAALVLADRDEDGRAWCRANVRKAFIGTAPLHVPVKRDFEAAYGVPLYESYGLSETLLAAAAGPRTGAVEGSVGVALNGVELDVREDGEVHVKTPHLMAGYWDPEKKCVTPRKASEWFASGDLGSLDREGRLSITGRKKDLIIRAGLNVSPLALENVLLGHPDVAQAAVVGVPSALSGEDIVAVVTAKTGVDRAKAQASLEAFREESFAAASRPRAILLIEEFPTGATGKVLKNKLREWAAGELIG